MSEILLSYGIWPFLGPIVMVIALVAWLVNFTAGFITTLLFLLIGPLISSSIEYGLSAERRALAESYIQKTMSHYASLDDVEGFEGNESSLRVKESGKNYKIITLEKRTGYPHNVTFTIKDDYSYTVHGY